MTLSSTGQLYGAPTATGSFPIVVQVKDHTTPTPLTASEPLTLVVNPALVFTTNATLPGAAVNAAYSQTIAAAGGVSPYGFTVATGSTLPSGLTLATGGLLSGTPTTAGAYAFTLQVTDATTPTPNVTTELFTLIVKAPLTISPTALPGATQNAVYQGLGLQFTATGGTGPYTWTETGTLPSTMSLQSNGLLRGNPQTSGSFPITVQVTDATTPTPLTASQPLTLIVDPALAFTSTSPLPGGTVNVAYSQQIAAQGGWTPYAFTVTSGSLPPGLTLASDGTLSGTPTTAGPYSFQVRLTDNTPGFPISISTFFSVTIQPGCSITPSGTLTAGTVGVAYSLGLAAGGSCTLPGNWGITNSPPGLSLAGQVVASTTETLEGTPTTAGRYLFTIGFSDAGASTTAFDTIFVQPAPNTCAILPVAVPDGTVGTSYGDGTNNVLTTTSECTTASDPTQWTWSVSGAPPGLSLVQGPSQTVPTATLQGTPTVPNAPNAYTFVVTFRNGPSDPGVTQSYTININPASGAVRVRTPVRAAAKAGRSP